MLEGVNSALSRIAEIKSHFHSSTNVGGVDLAPHYSASSQLQPMSYSATQVLPASPADLKLRPIKASDPAYNEAIETASSKYGVDSSLVKAVIRAESGFNPTAKSRSGAVGLMQLMPRTAAAYGATNPYDPKQNIDAGVKYLKRQIDTFGDVKLALAAYNAGPGAVSRYNGIPPYRETQNYVQKVLSYQEAYM